MKKITYYNIRVVTAVDEEQAINKVIDGKFNERHRLQDIIVTEQELKKALCPKKEPLYYFVIDRNGNVTAWQHEKELKTCLYSRGQAIRLANAIGGKVKVFKDKFNKNKHYIV